jgi:hypothetical protein
MGDKGGATAKAGGRGPAPGKAPTPAADKPKPPPGTTFEDTYGFKITFTVSRPHSPAC